MGPRWFVGDATVATKKEVRKMIGLPKYSTLDTVGSCLKRSAVRYPNKTALISGEKRLTYKEFNDEK